MGTPLAAVKPSVPTTGQGTWLGMQPAQVLLPLLGVLLLHHQQHVQGAALDLAALVRQYEDQVLGRQVALGEDEEAPEDPGAVGQPVEVHGWDSGLKLGQVSAVDVDQNDDPVVFHRGPVVWNGKSFDSKNQLVARKEKPIQVDTILTLNANKGKVISSFGKDMFYMPHGFNIDKEGNIWVTDVGLHQVMKFLPGATKPSLVLGEKFQPGSGPGQFCKPTSTQVSSTGIVFILMGIATAVCQYTTKLGGICTTSTGIGPSFTVWLFMNKRTFSALLIERGNRSSVLELDSGRLSSLVSLLRSSLALEGCLESQQGAQRLSRSMGKEITMIRQFRE